VPAHHTLVDPDQPLSPSDEWAKQRAFQRALDAMAGRLERSSLEANVAAQIASAEAALAQTAIAQTVLLELEAYLSAAQATAMLTSFAPPKELQAPTEALFNSLAEQWRRETAHLSSFSSIFMNASYQRIIGMGREAVPLILKRLQHEHEMWFWALHSISGDNPVKDEDAGSMPKMTQAWLAWGREKHLI
jgi:hypothetical protein